ncbi:uncharacterized protein LOC129739429 [Uranotaenia lowii]|uniref:uncharacterized protein LOC129739429 n=1 Tax=Uranotaenia lowii TaxID=190385 RepID=UPI00247A35D0|nr:uncharacterized protein LOC129739429 [Uranotaenia lowii]
MVPENPLKISSPWQCDRCRLRMDNAKVTKIQEIAGSMILSNAVKRDGAYIVEYLRDHVSRFLLPGNQFAVELKLQAIRKFQNALATDEQLGEKRRFCEDILAILRQLDIGECFIKGVLCYELFKVRMVLAQRTEQLECFPDRTALDNLRTAWIILGYSANRPRDLDQLAQCYGCNKL